MMKKIVGFCMIVLLLLLTECAPKTKIWTSNPVIQTSGNQYYEAQVETLKRDKKREYNFFVLFRLTVKNRTEKNLEIDWNKTRYIYNGRTHGGFVFRGIKPEDIKNLTIPSDIVPVGKTFSKEIAPAKLVAWAPYRDRSVGKNESGISPGIIPDGENGINLVVRYNGKEVREQITLTIVSKEAH